MSIVDLYRASRLETYKSVGLIRFWELLASKPGWSRNKAHTVLMRHDINPDMSLRSVRSEGVLARVESLIGLASDRWEQAPRMPAGYPYGARASLILEMLAEEGLPLEDFFSELKKEPELDSTNDIQDTGISPLVYTKEDKDSEDDELTDMLFGGDSDDEDDDSVDAEKELFGDDFYSDEDVADELFG